ncbi:hypothetical protein ABFS83_01G089000 [Erythranthe nasuta]
MAFAVRVSFFVVIFVILQIQALISAHHQVPCFFVFGDSLVDNGNNNRLVTEAKVDYLPYGVDFPQGPTGRFTNGRNTADILAQLLGFNSSVPPFATALGNDIIKGVNYASGSSGIRSETGEQLGDRISLDRQLQNHETTFSSISRLLGNDTSAKIHLSKCVYYFVVGSNDYINNYNMPEYYTTSTKYNPQEYSTILVQQYSQQLNSLYNNFGARKVVVSGVGPLGCTPAEIAKGTNGTACADSVNDAVTLFNDKLKLMVNGLNQNLTAAEFVYNGAMDLRPKDLIALGIRTVGKPCCKVSSKTGQCIKGEKPCLVRALHAFFDNFHPTEVVNNAVAAATYIQILKLLH